MALNKYLSVTTLIVNGLHDPVTMWDNWLYKKTEPAYTLSTRNQSRNKISTQAESERMEKNISCKWTLKKAWVAALVSYKLNFKTKAIIRDK